MGGLAPAAPPQAADRLRWLDLLPVIAFTVLGIILVFAVLVGLARGNRAFYRANLETISLSAALAVYLALGAGIVIALRRLRAPIAGDRADRADHNWSRGHPNADLEPETPVR